MAVTWNPGPGATAGNDTFTGDDAANLADALGGGDLMNGLGGDDTLVGGAGDDTLEGGVGQDSLRGGADNDVLFDSEFSAFNDLLMGDGGNDSINGGLGANTLLGGDGDDHIVIGGSLFSSFASQDSVDGGVGNDILTLFRIGQNTALTFTTSGMASDAGIAIGDGATIKNIERFELYTSDAGDTLTVNTALIGENIYDAGPGADRLIVDRRTSSASISSAETGGLVTFATGALYYYGVESFEMYGGSVGDTLVGGVGADVLDGAAGVDRLLGLGGLDTLIGGLGADFLDGGDGFDTMSFEGATLDTFAHFVWGYASGAEFLGAGGADIGSDTFARIEAILGGGGDDVYISGDGDNSLSGGAGSDWLQDIGTGNDTLLGGSGIDVLFGGEGNDSLDGGSETDGVFGEAGNDTLLGGLGDDWMEGGAGADSLVGGDGADVLIGNDDNDTAIGGLGNDALSGGAGTDSLDGGDGNDWITGEDGADTMNGGAGDDGLYGNAGANVYNAGDGDDGLTGGGDGETMNGDAGNDFIQGWGGADTLTGGAGSDTFVYQIVSDSTEAAPDRITDFDGAVDWLNLQPIDANFIDAGDQAFTLAASAGDGLAKAVLVFAAGVSTLSLYMNGDATADMVITFTGDVTGNTGHFVL